MQEVNSKFSISYGVFSDVDDIAQFQVEMALESENMVLDINTVLAGVEAVIDDPAKGTYIVARIDDKAVGSLMLTKEWSDWNNGWYWWIQSVFVRPEYRRMGAFTAMYDFLMDRAMSEGVTQVRLYVDKTNQVAQKRYQKLGMMESHYLMYERIISAR